MKTEYEHVRFEQSSTGPWVCTTPDRKEFGYIHTATRGPVFCRGVLLPRFTGQGIVFFAIMDRLVLLTSGQLRDISDFIDQIEENPADAN